MHRELGLARAKRLELAFQACQRDLGRIEIDLPLELTLRLTAFFCSTGDVVAVWGRFTLTALFSSGAVTMNTTSKTSMTSTSGVTLISLTTSSESPWNEPTSGARFPAYQRRSNGFLSVSSFGRVRRLDRAVDERVGEVFQSLASKSLSRRTKTLYARTAGTATAMPIPVAIKASPIGPATTSRLAEPVPLMRESAWMIPHTVPKSPTKGAVVPMLASTAQARLDAPSFLLQLLTQAPLEHVATHFEIVVVADGLGGVVPSIDTRRGDARRGPRYFGDLAA